MFKRISVTCDPTTDEEGERINIEHFLYKLRLAKRVSCAFPDVDITLRVYFVLVITNCGGERWFPKIKYIKNKSRTTVTGERLTYLALISIEYDICMRGKREVQSL